MRHTLLPLNERKVLRREYRVRVAIVACFVISLAGLAAIASVFPIFVRTTMERILQEKSLTILEQSNKDSELASLQQSVAKSQSLLEILSEGQDDPKVSDVIKNIVAMRRDIKLTSIYVTDVSSTTASISIQGVAPTRDSLLSFKKRFESAVPGNSVDLPVSELAKNSNIQFSLRLIQKMP